MTTNSCLSPSFTPWFCLTNILPAYVQGIGHDMRQATFLKLVAAMF